MVVAGVAVGDDGGAGGATPGVDVGVEAVVGASTVPAGACAGCVGPVGYGEARLAAGAVCVPAVGGLCHEVTPQTTQGAW
jgi:hypothetical protein